MRKLSIGTLSYNKPDMLDRMIMSIKSFSVTDWHLYILNNSPQNPQVDQIIIKHMNNDNRIEVLYNPENRGYAAGVNDLLKLTRGYSEYFAFMDDDSEIMSSGWDEKMCQLLDTYHELGIVGPNGLGCYPIDRGSYDEALWVTGCAWVLNRLAITDIAKLPIDQGKEFAGMFDNEIGHQNEVDFQIRLRLAGWKVGMAKDVNIVHHGVSTNNPTNAERIGQGVREWVDKWESYFGGKRQSYHSANVMRFELWPTTALYMEEWFKLQIPQVNDNPDTININGIEYDLIKVPRLKSFYRGRII